jgi:hypothetical protein
MNVLSKILAVGSIAGGIFLAACGNNNNNSITCPAGEVNENNTCIVAGATSGVYGNCGAGLVQTSAGCGTECSYANQIGGLINGQCLPAIAGVGGYGTNGYGAGQCASIPGTYAVQGPNGQILCEPGYSGAQGYPYGGAGYGGAYYYGAVR